jgi:DNA invertase Pin-like site-specific DNA recombinase
MEKRKKKRVISLYRVSSKKQVDRVRQAGGMEDKLDIPMQKQECREFIAKKPDWEPYRELSEFGVSGYKVSAKKRDAIQEIQQEALDGKFDVLLVYMFDRLGRIDDETPFIVEWFVKHGIEVWSTKEGEQRFEHHVDKLTNYIRFWQAAGESEKTSIRTRDRLSQIVQEGRFRGGVAPYGYRAVKRGRINKRGHEVYDIEIDEQEAIVVRLIFDLYLAKGYGSQRISTYLADHGMTNRKGENFTNVTINHMLRNTAYMGVLRSGSTVTDVFSNLQIVTPAIYESVQKTIAQRSEAKKNEHRFRFNTRGRSLLSGNAFCGHCGARLIVTTNGKKYVRKDGSVARTSRMRYVCYNKTRHKQHCNGQTGYSASKLDKMVDEVIRSLFARLKDLPKESIIEERHAEQVAESRMALTQAKAVLAKVMAEVSEYEAEVIKVIRGESKLNADLLNRLYEEAREKVAESELRVRELEGSLNDSEQKKAELSKRFDNIQSWSDMYDTCDIGTKKMVLSRIISAVRVKRDYAIEIDLTVDCEQFGIHLGEINTGETATCDRQTA